MRVLKRFFFAFFTIMVVFSSCKTVKTATNTTIKEPTLNTKKVITNHYDNTFRFESLKARIKAGYDDGKKTANLTASLRMEKDKHIWLSVKFGGLIVVAKALITPSKVQYYEVITNTYFDGDFTLLSKWLGTELDFQKVQNLLLGQAIFDLKKEKYDSVLELSYYKLSPKKTEALFQRLFAIQTQHFKLHYQKITQSVKNRELHIAYPEYQKVSNQDFPKKIQITAAQPAKTSTIVMEYKDVQYNPKVTFPFSIPSGAKQITIP